MYPKIYSSFPNFKKEKATTSSQNDKRKTASTILEIGSIYGPPPYKRN